MTINVHIAHADIHVDGSLPQVLARIDALSTQITIQGVQMATDFTSLEGELAQNTDVTASAVTLLHRLAEEIRAAGTDQAKLDALANDLDANSQNLGEAVAATEGVVDEGSPIDPGTSQGGENPSLPG